MISTASHAPEVAGERPIKVLFLASNPANTERLRIDREARLIRERLLATTHAAGVHIISRWAVRLDDLLQALLEVQPHIVHFSGHGTRSQEILLEDSAGVDVPVSASALAGIFGVLKDQISLVVLNACYSQQQAEAINQHIDVTIGMGRYVSDEAAIEFAATLYQAIGFGRSLQTAFDLARQVLDCKRIPGSDVPQIFVRPGVDPKRVMFVDAPCGRLPEPRREASARSSSPPPPQKMRASDVEPRSTPLRTDSQANAPKRADVKNITTEPSRVAGPRVKPAACEPVNAKATSKVTRDKTRGELHVSSPEASGAGKASAPCSSVAEVTPRRMTPRRHPIKVIGLFCARLAAVTCIQCHSSNVQYAPAFLDTPRVTQIAKSTPSEITGLTAMPRISTPPLSTAVPPRLATTVDPVVDCLPQITDPPPGRDKPTPRPPTPRPVQTPNPASGTAYCNNGSCMLQAEHGTFAANFTVCLGPAGNGIKCSIERISREGTMAACVQRDRGEEGNLDGPSMWGKCSN